MVWTQGDGFLGQDYRFKYLWSETEYVGVLAQEVLELVPEAVTIGEDGFFQVNYAVLGTQMVTYADWLRRNAMQTTIAA